MRYTLALLLLMGLHGLAVAAPNAEPWEYWTQHNSENEATIDHGTLTHFLQKYVVADKDLKLNRVRYGAVDEDDKNALQTYIRRLQNVRITDYNREVQRAYWINLYNAETINLVLSHYPVASIRKIGGGIFSHGPWDDELLKVEGKKLTLNDIEHRILRPIWQDPLNHYGVNCASVGCPNLRREAYTGANVSAALRDNARAYINSPRGLRFEDGKLQASNIYQWFAADFGNSETALISHLRQYAEPALSARLDAAGKIDSYFYDWSLNDAAKAAGAAGYR